MNYHNIILYIWITNNINYKAILQTQNIPSQQEG